MKCFVFVLLIAASSAICARETVKIVVPYTAGGVSDKLARQLQSYLSSDEYDFVVDNKPGAGGSIGATSVANEKHEPMLLVSGQALITNTLLGNAKYDVENDFVFLSCLVTDPIAVLVRADSPIKKFQDIRILSQTKTIPYGTSGIGTVQSIVSPILANGDINQIEIPFKGASDVMNALLSNTIVWYLDSVTLTSPLIDSGKFRMLAASQHLNKYPDVPTFKDIGVDIHGFKSRQLFVANTSISTKLKNYIIVRLNDKQMSQIITNTGYESCIDTEKPNALKAEKDVIKRLLK
jgi:tripartite-type tricarboxylate transporter receptor subunit TctC